MASYLTSFDSRKFDDGELFVPACSTAANLGGLGNWQQKARADSTRCTSYPPRDTNIAPNDPLDQYLYMHVNSDYRYTGYTGEDRPEYKSFFNARVVQLISYEITKRLKSKWNQTITIPKTSILSVMDSVFQNTYGAGSDWPTMIEMVINYVVQSINDEREVIEQNNKLSAWVQKYDKDTGLAQLDQGTVGGAIKKHGPTRFTFQMHY